jgi:hypothetical protein
VDVKKQGGLRKAIWIFAIGSTVLAISFYALRAVYAIAFFNGLTKNLQASGWVSPDSSSIVQVNEEMIFEASYLFFKIGSVKFQVVGRTEYDSLSVYHLRAYIDSYSGVPFVHFHSVYDTYADAKALFCLYDLRKQKEGDDWVYTTTTFNFDQKTIVWDQLKDGRSIKEVSLPLDSNYTNGVSFIYYLREACRNAQGKETKLDVPIIDDTVRSSIVLTINEKKEACEVSAFDFPLDAYRLSGHINFTGTFGISGDFVGWMANDSSALPLKAKVKVLIGSVVVQLKELKRENWIPPKWTRNE